MSRSPSPPLALGFVRVSQETQHIFPFPSGPSHQNLVSVDCIILHSETGSKKHDMVWLGMAVRADFNIVSFPAFDRNLVVQLAALCPILSTTDVKISFFLLPKCSCRLRYLPKPPSFLIFRIDFAVFFSFLRTFFDENVMADLSRFIF